MTYDIKLYNASGRSVELIDKATGRSWATIRPGHTKSFGYHGGVSLRCAGQQLTYPRIDPPSEYISAGLFSTSFKAQLGSDLRIFLLPRSLSPPAIHLPPQPMGFPLRPAKHGSIHAMERRPQTRDGSSCSVRRLELTSQIQHDQKYT
jgi:hypothetical protein